MISIQDAVSRLDPGSDRVTRLARLYAIFAAPGLLLVWLVKCWPAADGRHDLAGATLGHDLSQIWVAGGTALAGHAAEVYTVALHHHRLIEAFGPDAAMFTWHYPPVFLIVAAALALLPCFAAVLAWAGTSLLLVACALRTILGDWRYVVVGLAAPPVMDCLCYGQNGLLTASLLAFGLCWIDRRPILAGVLLGLVCYKPQLAVAAPLMMIATGRWRVAAASLASLLVVSLMSVLLFGPAVWAAFFGSLRESSTIVLDEAWGGLTLNASAFGAVRLLGGSTTLAWAAQIVAATLAAVVTLRVWLAPGSQALRNAVLLAAIALMSPYMPVYDLAVLVPAGAFFVTGARATGDLGAGERVALLALSALSFDPRDLTGATHVPCVFLLTAGAFALVATGAGRRTEGAAREGAALPSPDRALA